MTIRHDIGSINWLRLLAMTVLTLLITIVLGMSVFTARLSCVDLISLAWIGVFALVWVGVRTALWAWQILTAK